MNKKYKKIFVPSAYRDWSAIYCQFGWEDWVDEFKKQYNWGISDICFVWDGNVTTLYRAPEEHLMGLHDYVLTRVERDAQFLQKITENLRKEVRGSENYYLKLRKKNISQFTWGELSDEFKELKKYTIHPMPKVLISIYLPQAIQFMGTDSHAFPYIDDLIKAREDLDHVIGPMGNEFAEKFAQSALRKIDIDTHLGRFLSIEEFQKITSTKGNIQEDEKKQLITNLTERSSYFLVADGQVLKTPIKTYLNKKGWQLEEYDLETKTLSGAVAYKVNEKITGKVKIVLNKRQLNKVEVDDIVVAPMTTPEYAPIFSKLKAIITDEGGVTCHAAIIAREMRIPTIIGTKFASKILKDGDIVEINTKNGTIQIL